MEDARFVRKRLEAIATAAAHGGYHPTMTSDPAFVSKAIFEWWWYRRNNRLRIPPHRPGGRGSAPPNYAAQESRAAGAAPESSPAAVSSEAPLRRDGDTARRYVADILYHGSERPAPQRGGGGGGVVCCSRREMATPRCRPIREDLWNAVRDTVPLPHPSPAPAGPYCGSAGRFSLIHTHPASAHTSRVDLNPRRPDRRGRCLISAASEGRPPPQASTLVGGIVPSCAPSRRGV